MQKFSEAYKVYLWRFCRAHAKLAHYIDAVIHGIDINVPDLKQTLEAFHENRECLLEEKQRLGMEDGLSFLDDNAFKGFQIQNERFVGDDTNVPNIALRWVNEFPERANSYQYEVAVLLTAHLAPQVRKEVQYSGCKD